MRRMRERVKRINWQEPVCWLSLGAIVSVLAWVGTAPMFGCAQDAGGRMEVTPAEAAAHQHYSTTPGSVTTERTIEIQIGHAPGDHPNGPGAPPAPPAAPAPEQRAAPKPRDVPHDDSLGAAGVASRVLFEGVDLFPALFCFMDGETRTVGGSRIEGLRPGDTVTVTDKTTKTDPAVEQSADATGTGAGLKTDADKAKGDFDASAPESKLSPLGGGRGGGASASGGDTDLAYSFEQYAPSKQGGLVILGVLFLLAGAGVWYGAKRVGMSAAPVPLCLALLGGGCIGAAFLLDRPAIAALLVLGLLGVAGFLFVRHEWEDAQRAKAAQTNEKALKAAVAGVEVADGTGAVKSAIAQAASASYHEVNDVIQRLLREMGFGARVIPAGAAAGPPDKSPAATAAPAPGAPSAPATNTQ